MEKIDTRDHLKISGISLSDEVQIPIGWKCVLHVGLDLLMRSRFLLLQWGWKVAEIWWPWVRVVLLRSSQGLLHSIVGHMNRLIFIWSNFQALAVQVSFLRGPRPVHLFIVLSVLSAIVVDAHTARGARPSSCHLHLRQWAFLLSGDCLFHRHDVCVLRRSWCTFEGIYCIPPLLTDRLANARLFGSEELHYRCPEIYRKARKTGQYW